MTEDVQIETRDHVLRVTLNRPERRNAINSEMVAAIATAFEKAKDDPDIRVVLLGAKGDIFSAGGDIKDMANVLAPRGEDRAIFFRGVVEQDSMRLFTAMHALPQPVLVAVRGHAIGAGLQMCACADLVLASETAKFTIPQVNLAHTVDHGESWHLPRKIGYSRALQMCLLAERIDAATAEKFGLANWVVADADLEARAEAIVRQIASAPPVAARGMKTLLRASEGSSFAEQFAREQDMIGSAVATEDFVEALTAFAEKRQPAFTGS